MCSLTMEQPVLRIRKIYAPPAAVLLCSGEIDLTNVGRLRSALAGAIQTGLPQIEVDLRAVSFFDSTALDALLEAHRALAPPGRVLRVTASPWGRKLLHMTRLDRLFEVQTDDPGESSPVS